jgi:hypothetical protein
MAGYSGTPLLKKIGIKDGDRVLLANAPKKLPEELQTLSPSPRGDVEVAILFLQSRAELKRDWARTSARIVPDGMLWTAWPKKASGVVTDLTEDVIRNFALKTEFVDVKVCAIDDTWSGLKLVIRKEHRTARSKGAGK